VAAVIDTRQVSVVPVHPPDHPVKVESVAGVAIRVTLVPESKEAEHLGPQSMEAGVSDDVTVPSPVPAVCTVSENCCTLNVAVTVFAAVIETVHLAGEPSGLGQFVDQPSKTESGSADAARVTLLPDAKEATHASPQLIPAGSDVTEPPPAPALVTVKARKGTKVAVTVVATVIDTVQGSVPVQPPPDQPVKADVPPAVALRTTSVPMSKEAWHVAPQLIPAGSEVTVPVPVPSLLTVSTRSAVKLAFTVVAAVITTVQVPAPVQPPPVHPESRIPDAAVAVSSTLVP
jgi:hypothetical protein